MCGNFGGYVAGMDDFTTAGRAICGKSVGLIIAGRANCGKGVVFITSEGM